MLAKISAIIPTKNRPDDLLKAVKSICEQIRMPNELIIIDQSDTYKAKKLICSFMNEYTNIHLIYIYDPKILGLVDAKRVSVVHSTGNILCFLEDDVILEHNYFHEIEVGFLEKKEMIGCCGVITNLPKTSILRKWSYKIFHWGIFKDSRIDALVKSSRTSEIFIPSEMLSGGISAWRRSVFDVISFDVSNGFHMFEDIDFSTRVAKYFGPHLYINTRVRLAHFSSPLNREFFAARQRRKAKESFLYYKKRKDWPWASTSFFCLLIGMLLEATSESIATHSFQSIFGFFLGCQDGISKKLHP
jgi:glycosyltransferase involved in cell wall biosynthesis